MNQFNIKQALWRCVCLSNIYFKIISIHILILVLWARAVLFLTWLLHSHSLKNMLATYCTHTLKIIVWRAKGNWLLLPVGIFVQYFCLVVIIVNCLYFSPNNNRGFQRLSLFCLLDLLPEFWNCQSNINFFVFPFGFSSRALLTFWWRQFMPLKKQHYICPYILSVVVVILISFTYMNSTLETLIRSFIITTFQPFVRFVLSLLRMAAVVTCSEFLNSVV